MIHITLRQWPYVEWRQEAVTSKTVGWIALGICILSASTYNAFAKILTGALAPLTLLFLSEILMLFFVILSCGFMPLLRLTMRLPRRSLLPLVCIGLTNGTIAPLLLFPGLRMSTAVNASLFGNMEMVFLIVLAVIVLREKFRREHVLCVCTMLAGVLIIALRGFTEGLQFYPGDALLVLASLSFAIGSIIFRKFLHGTDPHVILFIRASVALCCFFVLSAFIGHPLIGEIRAFPLAMLPILLGFGFISRFLNIFSFYKALDHLRVTVVSLLSNLTVITSILFASWLLREEIFWYHLMGGALLILGTILLEVAGTHPSPKHLEMHHRSRGPRA